MTGRKIGLGLGILIVANLQAATYEPALITPPKPQREFRAAWVATVDNIDWPSKRGIPVAQQQAEIVKILDRKGLEAAACEHYTLTRDEYDRLLSFR